MTNKEYLDSLGIESQINYDRCLQVMEKYGDNHWWEIGVDERKLAYYQMNEPVLLVSNINRFKKALETLTGLTVFTHDIIDPQFKAVVNREWKRIKR